MVDRFLFSHFRPKWLDTVSARAWGRTFVGLQVDVQPILFACGLFALSFAITAFSNGVSAASANIGGALISGASWTVMFLAWYGYNFWLCANEVHDDQLQQIAELEMTLANRPRSYGMVAAPSKYDVTGKEVELTGVAAVGEVGSVTAVPPGQLSFEGHAPVAAISPTQSLADQLIQFRIDGVKLRNEKIPLGGFNEWKTRVDKWKSDVIGAIKTQANLADVARFVTLDRVPVMDFKWARGNKPHTKTLRELSRRVEILLEIMAKL